MLRPVSSLLPANASLLEKSLEQLNRRLSVFPFDSLNQFNPLTTHQSLLPYLAWQNRVFNWSDTATDLRMLIAQAPSINQKRGTDSALRFAIERVIPANEYTLSPWYQLNNGQPFTFAIHVNKDWPLDIRLYQKLNFYIDQMKSQRDQYALEVTLQMNLQRYSGGVAACFCRFTLTDLADDDTFKVPRVIGGVVQTFSRAQIDAPKNADALSDGVYHAGTVAFFQTFSMMNA